MQIAAVENTCCAERWVPISISLPGTGHTSLPAQPIWALVIIGVPSDCERPRVGVPGMWTVVSVSGISIHDGEDVPRKFCKFWTWSADWNMAGKTGGCSKVRWGSKSEDERWDGWTERVDGGKDEPLLSSTKISRAGRCVEGPYYSWHFLCLNTNLLHYF